MESQKEPGVSGKKKDGKTWTNFEELQKQKGFIDTVGEAPKAHNLYGRSDLENQDHPESANVLESEIVEVLKRSPHMDFKNIDVQVSDGVVYLTGYVEDMAELREMENIVRNVPGVTEIDSQVEVRSDENLNEGRV